jgi:hypothetical protein
MTMNKINIRARLEDLNILLKFEQGIITAERLWPYFKRREINYYDIEKWLQHLILKY